MDNPEAFQQESVQPYRDQGLLFRNGRSPSFFRSDLQKWSRHQGPGFLHEEQAHQVREHQHPKRPLPSSEGFPQELRNGLLSETEFLLSLLSHTEKQLGSG